MPDNGSTRYVAGFVGVVGPNARSTTLVVPSTDFFPVGRETIGSWNKVLCYGTTPETLLQKPLPDGNLVFKGRPFYLSQPITTPRWNFAEPASRNHLLENLDGKWSMCFVSEHMLLCATDLIGAGSIYYSSRGNQLYVSTHLGVLLATLNERWEYDDMGIASILFSRGLVQGRTHVRGISRLGHGGYIAVERTSDRELRPVIGTYADTEKVLQAECHDDDIDRSADTFERLLCESLERENLTEDCVLMLSGGLDSKAIGTVARRNLDLSMPTLTYGEWDSKDVFGGKAAADALGLPHGVVPYDEWNFHTYANRITRFAGGVSGLQVSQHLPGFEYAKSHGTTAIVGFLGGTMSGGFLPKSGQVTGGHVRKKVLQRLGYEPSVERLFSDEIDHLKAHLKVAYRELSCRPEQRAQLIDWTTRQATWISATFDVAETFLPVAYPFYSRPLMQFMFNLRGQLLRDQKLYRYWLRRCSQKERTSSGAEQSKVVTSPSTLNTTDVVNWRVRVENSSVWLNDTIDHYCDDLRLKKVCRTSLDNTLHEDDPHTPTVLWTVPIFLSRYLGERVS